MRDILKKYWRIIFILAAVISNIFLWYVVSCEAPSKNLKVAFLNIGQGDSIYIESPTHNRILVDGGPPHAILSELRKVMPFYIRSLDTLIVTNPDSDHYAGFIDVLHQYHVTRILEPGTKTTTATYTEFKKIISDKNVPDSLAKRGMILHLGNNTDLKILFPDQDVSTWATNDGSVVAQLVYGNTSVMLTGDAPSKTEEYVLSLDGAAGVRSTILKAGHHGSKTSASESFVSAVNPQYAMISAGLNNKYGHPNKETVDLFNKLHIPMLVTFKVGTVIATSDGKAFNITTEK